MMIDEAFCKFMVESFGRGIARREDKFIFRVSINSNKYECYLFCDANLSSGCWMITPRSDRAFEILEYIHAVIHR